MEPSVTKSYDECDVEVIDETEGGDEPVKIKGSNEGVLVKKGNCDEGMHTETVEDSSCEKVSNDCGVTEEPLKKVLKLEEIEESKNEVFIRLFFFLIGEQARNSLFFFKFFILFWICK